MGGCASLKVKKLDTAAGANLAENGTAELVSHQRLPGHACLIVKPGVRGSSAVAVVVVKRTVALIGPAFRHQGNLSTGRPALVWPFASDSYAKLLYRVERDGKYGVKAGIGGCAVGIRSLVATCAGCRGLRDEAGILFIVSVGPVQRKVVRIRRRAEPFPFEGTPGWTPQRLADIGSV